LGSFVGFALGQQNIISLAYIFNKKMFSAIDNEVFFPNLPGYRSKPVPSGSKKTSLRLVDGLPIVSEDFLPRLTKNRDQKDIDERNATSLVSMTSSLVPRMKIRISPSKVGVILNFKAFFEEDIAYSSKSHERSRIRVCNIMYFAESGCITVVEKPQPNSGIPQGKQPISLLMLSTCLIEILSKEHLFEKILL
jgi:hypothetical protein